MWSFFFVFHHEVNENWSMGVLRVINAVQRAGYTWRCPDDAPVQVKWPNCTGGEMWLMCPFRQGSGTAAAASFNSTHAFNTHSFCFRLSWNCFCAALLQRSQFHSTWAQNKGIKCVNFLHTFRAGCPAARHRELVQQGETTSAMNNIYFT